MESIAIIGMACRFPGAPSLDAYWRLLSKGLDAIDTVPADRWDIEQYYHSDAKVQGKMNTRKGGFIKDIDLFDAFFFNISPREAKQMDPQQRILLELSYETFNDAGIAPQSLLGSDTAVYIGVMSNDYLRHQLADNYTQIDVHTGGGTGYSMIANRLSYQFGLHGPSFAIDSACSSSLVSIFQACQALWTQQTSLALAGGVNLMLDPATHIFYTKGGLSAPDGHCKTFSASANGLGRGEGAGLVLLKRESDALRDGDQIYAVIRGGAVNHDGRSNGITSPNRWAQASLLRCALRHAQIQGDQLDYIELHGTGTYIGDPIEANAIGEVLNESQRQSPCLVGSVKSNIGHLEGAAGVAGFIKLVLSMYYRQIPASLGYDQPNPSIDFSQLPLSVNTHLSDWPQANNDIYFAGINSFGLGGTNAHLVLSSVVRAVEKSAAQPNAQHMLLLSARSKAALTTQVQQYYRLLDSDIDLDAVCMTALRSRDIHEHRLCVLGEDRNAILRSLGNYLAESETDSLLYGQYKMRQRPIVLQLPDMGSFTPDRLARWLNLAPVGKIALENCREILAKEWDKTLPDVAELATSRLPDDATSRNLWCFAAQYAVLQQMAASLPTITLIQAEGRSQLAAAVTAGAISLADALHWLVGDLTANAPATENYTIDCAFSAGINPSLADVNWQAATIAGSATPKDAILVSLNLDGICPAVPETLYCLGQHEHDFGYLFGRLALVSQLIWKTLGYARLTKLPSYPWQRQSLWLPKPTATDQQPVTNDAIVASQPVMASSTSIERMALQQLTAQEQRETLLTYLQSRVAAALHMSIEQINVEQPLNTLGMDSLTAVEIKNRIERDLKVVVSVVKFLDGYSVVDFADVIATDLTQKTTERADTTTTPAAPTQSKPMQAPTEQDDSNLSAAILQQVDALLANDVDALLLQLNQPHPPAAVVASINLAQLNDKQRLALSAQLLAKKQQQVLVLSTTQERIWQLDQIMPANPVYNFQSAITLQGKLNQHALTQAANAIVMAHETLRISYASLQGKAHLTLLPELNITIEQHDWRHLLEQQQQSDLQEAARQTAQTGFTLAKPPLLRLQCYQMANDAHVLVLTMHHIVSDLLSLDLFFAELGQFYTQYNDNQIPLITAPDWTYQQYAHAERSARAALLQSPSADFWRTYLANAAKLDWYSDFPRPKVTSGKAATAHFTLTPELVKAVETLARNEKVTPFVVLLSIYYIFQWAISGSDAQLVAVPNAGRNNAGVENLIGMFSSPMPITADLSGQPDLHELLQRVKTSVFAITEHAGLPFADIVDLAQEAADGQPLLLRSMFSFINRMKPLSFAGLHLTRTPTERGISDFDLFMTIYRDNDRWRGVFEYNTDLFSQARGEDWALAYARLVEIAVNNDLTQPISQLAAQVPVPKYQQIAVAATFTADPLEEVVSFWQQELRLPTRLKLAPYNQVFQTLMDPNSELHPDENTLNVLLIRPEDWVRYHHDSHDRRAMLDKATHEFIDAVRQVKLRAPLFIYLCPPSPETADMDSIQAAVKHIEAALVGLKGITLLQADELCERYALSEIHDPQTDDIGHIPYTRAWFVALGTELVRKAHSVSCPPYKVIALDCDNTLWQGVCGEEGALGVHISEPFRQLQQFVLRQIDAGMLVCLVSKNEEADVLQVFDEHPDMLLKREHIVGQRINWLVKSDNLRSLAAELDLGLDSFIFIDDNPVECAEVQAFSPEVLTLCLPQDASQRMAFLNNVWAFDKYQISHEDRQRTISYQQNRQREALRQEQDSFTNFLEKLALQITFLPEMDDEQLTRIAQLSRRTNQFNNNATQYDDVDLHQFIREGSRIVGIQVQDRFGSYGLVGALLYRQSDNTLYIDKFMLSCRVLGKGVEHKIISWVGQQALKQDGRKVVIHFKKLPRNQPFLRFVDGLDGEWDQQMTRYALTSQQAADSTFIPQHQQDNVVSDKQAVASSYVSDVHVSDVHVVQRNALIDIAFNLRHADEILLKLDKHHARRKLNTSCINPPQGLIEQAIAEIWQTALRTDAINRDDNFFDIGGNSLLLVQINGRLNEHFSRDIAITALFQFPTISSLAQHLRSDKTPAELNANIQQRADNARNQLQQRMKRLRGGRTGNNHSTHTSTTRN